MALVGGCYSLDDLFTRVKSSRQMATWLLYLQLREEEEAARMQAMFGEA